MTDKRIIIIRNEHCTREDQEMANAFIGKYNRLFLIIPVFYIITISMAHERYVAGTLFTMDSFEYLAEPFGISLIGTLWMWYKLSQRNPMEKKVIIGSLERLPKKKNSVTAAPSTTYSLFLVGYSEDKNAHVRADEKAFQDDLKIQDLEIGDRIKIDSTLDDVVFRVRRAD